MIISNDINFKTSVCDSIRFTSKICEYEFGGRDLYDLYSNLDIKLLRSEVLQYERGMWSHWAQVILP